MNEDSKKMVCFYYLFYFFLLFDNKKIETPPLNFPPYIPFNFHQPRIYLNTTKCLKPLLLTAPISAYPDFRGLKDALNFICIRENREGGLLNN